MWKRLTLVWLLVTVCLRWEGGSVTEISAHKIANRPKNVCGDVACYDKLDTCLVEKLGGDNELVEVGTSLLRVTNLEKFSKFRTHLNEPCNLEMGFKDISKTGNIDEVVSTKLFGKMVHKKLDRMSTFKRPENGYNYDNGDIDNDAEEDNLSCSANTEVGAKLCDIETIHTEGGDMVDLLLDPEAYTGYPAAHSHKIWASVYGLTCTGDTSGLSAANADRFASSEVENVINKHCDKDNYMFRFLSGLHTSISMHLCKRWCDAKDPSWRSNYECYNAKVKNYKLRKENFFFLSNFISLALKKSVPHIENLRKSTNKTLKGKKLIEFNDKIDGLIASLNAWKPKNPENLSDLQNKLSIHPQTSIATFEKNISKIFDCIDCSRCRLWGKLQLKGLCTAIEILTIPSRTFPDNSIVALVNLANNLFRSTRYMCDFECSRAESHLYKYAKIASVPCALAFIATTVLFIKKRTFLHRPSHRKSN